jgi:glycerol-3-phosphate acyltransferase PlsY
MDDTVKVVLLVVYGYLIGSVPSAYVVGRVVKGIDLRALGSGTMGASNVWYHVGKGWIFPVGFFDVFVKGSSPMWIARGLDMDLSVQAAAGFMAVIGHNWPIFLKFLGGRGVAPIVGVLIAMGRLELGAFIVIGTAGWRLTGSAAVWVLIGMAMLPLFSLWWQRPTAVVLLMVGILSVTVAKRLASNSLKASGIGIIPLLWNRLVYDRDIRDHDAWVNRDQAATE